MGYQQLLWLAIYYGPRYTGRIDRLLFIAALLCNPCMLVDKHFFNVNILRTVK